MGKWDYNWSGMALDQMALSATLWIQEQLTIHDWQHFYLGSESLRYTTEFCPLVSKLQKSK